MKTAKSFGVELWGEAFPLEKQLPVLEAQFRPIVDLPAFAQKYAPEDVIDIQDNEFRMYERGRVTDFADDPAASDKKSATIIGDTHEWAINAEFATTDVANEPEDWHIYALVRATLKPGAAAPAPQVQAPVAAEPRQLGAKEERVRMTRLRQTIARRLKEAQNSAAMLTTFNEVDMSAVMTLRNQYKDQFEKRHGVKLGFMGFFVKACIAALKEIPAVNAEIEGTDLIYKNHYDIGVAVGTEKGLVVPVVRDADQLSLAGVEKTIGDLGKKARDGELSLEDLQGGTFTISNGGVYGSLMSTPILNAPQSGILGMHKIQERPMAVNGQVVIRPMMYLALSYDHRIVDGKEAVTFLVRVKENIEDPERLLLEV